METTPEDILTQAFLALDDVGLGNLLWHADQGTAICCGDEARYFTTISGAG